MKESAAKSIFQMWWLIIVQWLNLYANCNTHQCMQQKEYFCGLFNIIQVAGYPNTMVIGDWLHDV